jgi:HlyD family secretion protein
MKNYVTVMLVGLLISCNSSKKESVFPTYEKITESIYASGYIKSKDQYQVYTKASGILEKTWVQKGDSVSVGQILFTIANEASKLSKENAELAALNSAFNANLDKLEELKLNIELNKKRLDNEELMLKRQKALWEKNIGTKIELEQREISVSNLKAIYLSSQLRYNDLKKQLSFAEKQSQKNLSINQSMLADYFVKSNINGIVYDIFKENGEIITNQTPLAIVGSGSEFVLMLQIDEKDIIKAKLGQKVLVIMDSYKDKAFEAEISKINPIMNQQTRTFEIEAVFVKAPEVLYPNLTLEANIIIKTKDNALTIPRMFLVEDSFVLDKNLEKKKVKVGLKDFQKVEIIKGISETDEIYTTN